MLVVSFISANTELAGTLGTQRRLGSPIALQQDPADPVVVNGLSEEGVEQIDPCMVAA